jgi:serine-type D-Ala-D-Ala carboxypeptidase (penicillin-binding protein 5/6)
MKGWEMSSGKHVVFLARVSIVLILGIYGASLNAAILPTPKPPTIDARSYILLDHHSGKVLAEKAADERVEPASITKVMTAYVAFDAIQKGRVTLTSEVPISEKAWRQGIDSSESRMFLEVGKTVQLSDLLRGIIIQSGNDASVAIAEFLGGTEAGFAEMMNHYARGLGMKNTQFADASGMPLPNHYTTARDIAIMSRALINNFPQLYKIFAEREFTFHDIRQVNRNGLLARDPSVDGIKTGHTSSAGYCLAVSAKRDDMRLISVVMGTPSIGAREAASAALLSYGYTFFETGKLKARNSVVAQASVYKGTVESINAQLARDIFVTVPRGELTKSKMNVTLNAPLIAPLANNKPIGQAVFTSATGEVWARVPVFPNTAVATGSWWTQMTDSIALWFE